MKYSGDYTKEISFPLGGIGTGSIGLGGNGRLLDWEIFNRPDKGSVNGYSHFAIKAIQGEKHLSYVLNGDLTQNLMGQYRKSKFCGYGFGPDAKTMCGFPHFKNLEFNGEFPIAKLSFKDDKFPGDVTMTAFNPFIPNDSKNSSIPAAFFEIEVKNTTNLPIKYQVALSVQNPYESSVNQSVKSNGVSAVTLSNAAASKESTEYGDLTIATDCETTYIQQYWYRGRWQDNIVSFWNDFDSTENIKPREYDQAGKNDTATVVAEIEVMPQQHKKVHFVLSWNVPNNFRYWNTMDGETIDTPWKNYYATVFEDSMDTADYCLKNYESLYQRTLNFKNLLFSSSLPTEVKEAASANLAVLKSPTVLRLEDGSFYGWEGVHEQFGSCDGTCQHVWNYAYAMCFLFPDLERSIRQIEFDYSTDKDGKTSFRVQLPLGEAEMLPFRACLDGQMGCVIKCYREWKISGNNEWLKNNWEKIKMVLEYAWSDKNPDKWDKNKDGVLEGRQHHTLDMELFGPSSWLEGMYLAALKAASEMAEFLGDSAKSEEYRLLFQNGFKYTKENLFNGKYFIQKIDVCDKTLLEGYDETALSYWNSEENQIKYQIGDGSSIDQLLAQWHADVLGLGDIFDNEQVDVALDEMMKNNYKTAVREFTNPWRIFALNDESASVICDYPKGSKKPKIPIPYCEEAMTGFEYSFAGMLLSRGKIEEGIKVVEAVRNRFNGEKRNPWNEFECGSNYARSMASYALVPILSGFQFDMPNNHIGFNPYKKDDFNSIWSIDGAWGQFELKKGKCILKIEEGSITLKSFGANFKDKVSQVKIDGKDVEFEYLDGRIMFEKTKITDSLEMF